MSNGPSPEPKSSQPHQRRRIWKATGLTLGAIATLGIAGGGLVGLDVRQRRTRALGL